MLLHHRCDVYLFTRFYLFSIPSCSTATRILMHSFFMRKFEFYSIYWWWLMNNWVLKKTMKISPSFWTMLGRATSKHRTFRINQHDDLWYAHHTCSRGRKKWWNRRWLKLSQTKHQHKIRIDEMERRTLKSQTNNNTITIDQAKLSMNSNNESTEQFHHSANITRSYEAFIYLTLISM